MRVEGDVREVAGNRHRTDGRVEQQVADHARLQPARCAELPGLRNKVQADAGRDEIPCDRHQPEHGVESKARPE